MNPEPEFVAFVEAVEGAIPGGTVSVLSVLVCGFVAVYRREWLQRNLPRALQWEHWPRLQKWAVSFGLGLACGTLTNLAAGKSWPMAVGLGVGTGAGAIFTRETYKAGESAVRPKYVDVLPPTSAHFDRLKPEE